MAPCAADTPLVEVDIAAVERNIARMQRYCDAHGLRLWAHSKTHKLPQIAARQIAGGAAGVVCQKLGEAEVMAGEADDILITFPLVGEVKWRRLAALARRVRVTVIADSDLVARGLSQALAEDGATVDLLVDCDTGFGRTHAEPGDHRRRLENTHKRPGPPVGARLRARRRIPGGRDHVAE
ncbi:MAG: hypothetical protein QOH72_3789 [Solirubrobacteraceae bacterium]|jgi:D-serine deaminase-like pyridoxal phosphate-dependent protein|nr:hypothetical protein [Solirubrobacteraceae bacterium]